MPTSTATAARSGQDRRPLSAAPLPVDDPGCDVCPHPVVDHDAIALRFCRATKNTATERGCVCRSA